MLLLDLYPDNDFMNKSIIVVTGIIIILTSVIVFDLASVLFIFLISMGSTSGYTCSMIDIHTHACNTSSHRLGFHNLGCKYHAPYLVL